MSETNFFLRLQNLLTTPATLLAELREVAASQFASSELNDILLHRKN
jgi:hypothetical protein